MSNRLIGAHVSAAGGVEYALERAAVIGANCLQIFSGSPRVWAKKPLIEHNFKKIAENSQKLGVMPIFTHAIYLTNLATDNQELLLKTRQSLSYDLAFDGMVKGGGVVVHLGSHQGRGWEAVREQVAMEIKKLLAESDQQSSFLIENSAGQNGKLCSDLGEIRWLIDRINQLRGKKDQRLGWCFDTCHAHAAGYNLGDGKMIASPKNPGRGQAAAAIEQLNLWPELKCLHVNDSRDPFGAGRDRHANLKEGEITVRDMTKFLCHKQLKEIPMILEVPGLDGQGPDKENINRLKAIVASCHSS